MADRQLQDFYRRAGRYERAFARGRGFEAPGTLGRSAYRRRRGFDIPILAPLCVLAGVCLLMKVAILLQLGPDLYAQRLERLQNGGTAEWLGATFLAPDPVTTRLAEEIQRLF